MSNYYRWLICLYLCLNDLLKVLNIKWVRNNNTLYTYCLSKLFVESDNELNDVYKELKGKIDAVTQKALKDTEIRWIKYRTSKCEVSPGTIDVRCSYEVNRDRTNFLRDRLRECNSRMCDNAAIGKQSW